MKKIIFVTILTLVLNFYIKPVDAAMEIIVDNDNSTSTGTNVYSYLSNFSYHTGSGYRNDYRKCQIRDNMEVSSYGWRFYTQYTGHVTYQVYLANSQFTTPHIPYVISHVYQSMGNMVNINQNTAPSGWNTIGKFANGSNNTIAIYPEMQVVPTPGLRGVVGVDAARILY